MPHVCEGEEGTVKRNTFLDSRIGQFYYSLTGRPAGFVG